MRAEPVVDRMTSLTRRSVVSRNLKAWHDPKAGHKKGNHLKLKAYSVRHSPAERLCRARR